MVDYNQDRMDVLVFPKSGSQNALEILSMAKKVSTLLTELNIKINRLEKRVEEIEKRSEE